MAGTWDPFNAQSAAATYIDNVTPTTLYTATNTAGLQARIEKLLIVNTDTTTNVTCELYVLPSGGSISGDNFKIVKGFNVRPSNGYYGTWDVREAAGIILGPNETIRALAGTASKLRFFLSGFQES
jgi:hypothetical protein